MAMKARASWLLPLLLAAPLAAALGPSAEPLASPVSQVVIAVIDTGINPYHEAFRAPPGLAAPWDVRGYPSSSLPLRLTLDAPSYQQAWTGDLAVWQGVQRGQLYHIPGTRIVGAVSLGEPGDGFTGPLRILDDVGRGHGTATASLAAGEGIGACPSCLLVAIEGPGDAALRWALEQPWIDVVSNSWGLAMNVDWPHALGWDLGAEYTKAMVREGKTVLFSAGNGLGSSVAEPYSSYPDYLLPGETTYTSRYTGPDWVVTVGAVDPRTMQPVAGSARPVDVVAAGVDLRAASAGSRWATRPFEGTSASAPIAAGVFGQALLGLRSALGDPDEGPRSVAEAGLEQVVAMAPGGLAPPGAGAGPLADARLTRHELQRLVFSTALPCTIAGARACAEAAAWPAPERVYGWSLPTPPLAYPLVVGYGHVDARTAQAAVLAGLGAGPLPRPEADLWAASDSLIRQRLWGTWGHGAKPSDLVGV